MHLSMQLAASLRGQLGSAFLRSFARDFRRAGRLALRRHHTSAEGGELAIVSLRWVDDAEISRLNLAHMGKRGTTDVLSFPAEAPGGLLGTDEAELTEILGETQAFLGDIVLCWSECLRQAARHNARSLGGSSSQEIRNTALLLAVHGLAHLLGHDHLGAVEGRKMHRLESLSLRRIRVADRERPYARRVRSS